MSSFVVVQLNGDPRSVYAGPSLAEALASAAPGEREGVEWAELEAETAAEARARFTADRAGRRALELVRLRPDRREAWRRAPPPPKQCFVVAVDHPDHGKALVGSDVSAHRPRRWVGATLDELLTRSDLAPRPDRVRCFKVQAFSEEHALAVLDGRWAREPTDVEELGERRWGEAAETRARASDEAEWGPRLAPEEHAILSTWFGLEPPAFAASASVWRYSAFVREYGQEEAEAMEGEEIDVPLLAAYVAQLLLHDLPARLFGSDEVEEEGSDEVEKEGSKDTVGTGDGPFRPRLLFAIEGPVSGPCYASSEAFWVVDVPYYHRTVVIASFDSSDTPEALFGLSGFSALALGSFPRGTPPVVGAQPLVRALWGREVEGREGPAERFDRVSSGLVDADEVEDWADPYFEARPSEEEEDESTLEDDEEGETDEAEDESQ